MRVRQGSDRGFELKADEKAARVKKTKSNPNSKVLLCIFMFDHILCLNHGRVNPLNQKLAWIENTALN